MNYQDTILTLARNLLVDFDEVYHSAEIITTDGIKKPAISILDEWIDLSPSDTREILYIRRNGADEVSGDLKIGSCSKDYKMRSPLRIVFFKDHAEKHSEILYKLLQSVLIQGVKLKSIQRDKWKLLKEESSGDYSLGPDTAYFGIDIYLSWDLMPETCEQDFCADIKNPLTKTSCPVVA